MELNLGHQTKVHFQEVVWWY